MKILGSTFLPVMDALRPKLVAPMTLRAHQANVPLVDQVRDVDVIILGMFKLDRNVIDAAPMLRLVHQHGRGVDGVDMAYATSKGILVANAPGGNNVAVAEHALGLMFYLAKRYRAAERAVAQRVTGAPPGIELLGKTVGIVGLGGSGVELARRAKALGMTVIATRQRVGEGKPDYVDWLGRPGELRELLARSDFVSLHAALTDETRGLIGREQLRACKRSAYLINVARAPLVDKEALHAALREGTIAGAAFDVFWSEPADPADPILACDNFVLTPHTAGFSDASIDYVCGIIADNLGRLARGEPLVNVVNRP